MTGSIYRSEFEVIKAQHIMRRRVPYMSNGETGNNKRSVRRVFAGKNKLLEKCFGETSLGHVDVNKVQHTFSRIQ